MTHTKILTTFGVGPAKAALEISLPRMAAYAAKHGYTLIVPSDEQVIACCDNRHPSWGKINWLDHLCQSYGNPMLLWLDSDVVVSRFDVDIASEQRVDTLVSMVVQNTADGAVPSCGVMLIDDWPGAPGVDYPAIWKAAGPDGMNSPRSSCWWEQVAMIRWLGGDPDMTPIVPPIPSEKWGTLSYEWNPHPNDPRGVPDDCRFFHATATGDRLGAMRQWVANHPMPENL